MNLQDKQEQRQCVSSEVYSSEWGLHPPMSYRKQPCQGEPTIGNKCVAYIDVKSLATSNHIVLKGNKNQMGCTTFYQYLKYARELVPNLQLVINVLHT